MYFGISVSLIVQYARLRAYCREMRSGEAAFRCAFLRSARGSKEALI